ncbi:T-cell activation Rho GTPase-activating protein-like isoform X2 [Ruditapes philippinarum]|uniref:T-cell activation Rho GTPase-activating protein-like isoform X2 n=1 Tax=Ruditapes philippinarum TaxID=129788 RepID=UPI00295B245B|nr:T-cell activation Rho GTPase-activating protein-like isoform X2 [Ruditapes philippinarum]
MLRNVFGCVSDRSTEAMRHQKIKFGAPLSTALKNGYLPIPMVELLVYVAREGLNTRDIFRRPGNPNDTRRVVKRLSEGKPVIFSNYSFYTLASVIKKFLLSIPEGVFSPEGEESLLKTLTIGHKMEQYDAIHDYITSCSPAHQQLLSLLFGIWFTMVHNSQQNYMSTEALSRSVAGSMFHTCAMDPAKVEKASRIMQLLIDNFGVARVFGQHNIEYFAEVTHIEIHVRETFKYQYSYPAEDILPPISEDAYKDMAFPRLTRTRETDLAQTSESQEGDGNQTEEKNGRREEEESNLLVTSTVSVPEVSLVPSPEVTKRPKSVEDSLNEAHNHTLPKPSLSRYNSVKRKQLERLRQRSDWFLGPSTVSNTVINISSPVIHIDPPPSPPTIHHEPVQKKSSGNSVTRSSSEGAVLDGFSDHDSIYSDHSSRSESPASEPARTNNAALCIRRDIVHSDTLDSLTGDLEDSNGNCVGLSEDEMTESEICYFMIEHKYGEPRS